MGKLDYLLSLANIHGPSPRDVPGNSSEQRELTSMDVHAACAFGHLPPQSYVIGQAVHMKDEMARHAVLQYGIHVVQQTFKQEGWSAVSPYEKRYNRLANIGMISQSEADEYKKADALTLPYALAGLVVVDMDGAQDCPQCDRAGRLVRHSNCRSCCDGFVWRERVIERPTLWVPEGCTIDAPAFRVNRERCTRCNGNGEREQFLECDTCKGRGRVSGLTDTERARRCAMTPDAWRKNWRRRYLDYILRRFDHWLIDYEDHIVRKT